MKFVGIIVGVVFGVSVIFIPTSIQTVEILNECKDPQMCINLYSSTIHISKVDIPLTSFIVSGRDGIDANPASILINFSTGFVVGCLMFYLIDKKLRHRRESS